MKGTTALLIASLIVTSFFGGAIVQKLKMQENDMSTGMIEKVEVRVGYTVNAGNYESVRVDLGVTRFIGEGEDTKVIMKAMRDQLRKEVQTAAKEELQAMKGGKRG